MSFYIVPKTIFLHPCKEIYTKRMSEFIEQLKTKED